MNPLLPADFDRQVFLRDYWQKKPLLIRAGTAGFVDPISPEELAGLACEDEVESRLVCVSAEQDEWTLKTGPFTEKIFLELPETHYSLLVQAVDQWVDDVGAMLTDFDFIPGWRIDDIMVSYATDQGNVGPHFDYYDVFLIQGMGHKRWQIGGHCTSLTPRSDDSGLRLLRNFICEQEWTVNPGDMLYLPPGIAHYGIAVGNSMTYSVGFRAPSFAEIVSGLTDEVLDSLSEDQRYTDSSILLPNHPGEIDEQVIIKLREDILRLFDRPDVVRRWFGKNMTQPKYPADADSLFCDDNPHFYEVADLRKAISSGAEVYRVPGVRFAYAYAETDSVSKKDQSLELFADGECYPCQNSAMPLLQALSTVGPTDAVDTLLIADCLENDALSELLFALQNNHCLIIG